MPLIITASNDLDSSVMIASVRQFQNPNRRGATMRMNTEGLHFVSTHVHNCIHILKNIYKNSLNYATFFTKLKIYLCIICDTSSFILSVCRCVISQ